jgi:NAD(P) transhydrogenase subunit alpha
MLNNVIIFVLSAFIGREVLSKVPQTLHTPLMSGANAISGITIVGALVASGMTGSPWAEWIGFAALIAATINVVGGYLVTDRMLQMFVIKAPRQVEGTPQREALTTGNGQADKAPARRRVTTPFK